MKNILILAFIAFAGGLYAQQTVKMNQDSVLYLTDKQEAFMVDKETKYLIKTGPIGFERKLSQSISLNTVFQPTFSGSRGLRVESRLELRYYYKMAKLIAEGKQANNLSSEYFSAGVDFNGIPFSGNGLVSNSFGYNINWGLQRRFLNYGYIDLGLGLSYNTLDYRFPSLELINSSSVSLSNRTSVGFAFGKKYDISDVVKCPIFKCHLDRKSVSKFNLNKLFSISYGTSSIIENKYRFSAILNPEISYEHKLGASSFSIDQELDFLVGFSSRISNMNQDAGISHYRLGYTVTLRHYFQLNSNIKKGKSGNNLSGFYWFVGGSFQYGDSKLPLFGQEVDSVVGKHNYIDVPFGVGYQKTMLNNFYFDFQAGFKGRVSQKIIPQDNASHYLGGSIEFKVGKLF